MVAATHQILATLCPNNPRHHTHRGFYSCVPIALPQFCLPPPWRVLPPRLLARIIDGSCGNRPTVVVVSACFSGAFVPALAGKNRLILTAARRDRSSFGCGQTDKYPYFDECVLSVWPHVSDFVALGRAARTCVATREKEEHVGPPSEPQLRVGANIAAALPKWR